MKTEKSVVEQAVDALRLWSNNWYEFDRTSKNKPLSIQEVIEPFIQMEEDEKHNAYMFGHGVGFVKAKEIERLESRHNEAISRHNEVTTFEQAVKPLMKWLCENTHPHTMAIVDGTLAQLVEGVENVKTEEFLVD